VVGRREQEAGTVMLRTRGREKQEGMPLDAFVARVREEIRTRALTPVSDAAAESAARAADAEAAKSAN
ncbi:MAG: His/Gly/Thr/Pro-type tRNA ligase C-terminal domain-containing protein, partial [Gemmatirosa sp.]